MSTFAALVPAGGRKRSGQAAYTMVELIMVIVLIGILSSVAGPRFFSTSEFDNRRFADELASSIRYAQKVAVATGCAVEIRITATAYRLGQQPAAGGHCNSSSTQFPTPVLLPTGQRTEGSAPSGTSIGAPTSIVFSGSGNTNLPADVSMMIGSTTLVVRGQSGLVTVQ